MCAYTKISTSLPSLPSMSETEILPPPELFTVMCINLEYQLPLSFNFCVFYYTDTMSGPQKSYTLPSLATVIIKD